jgi:hypothetical protein
VDAGIATRDAGVSFNRNRGDSERRLILAEE